MISMQKERIESLRRELAEGREYLNILVRADQNIHRHEKKEAVTGEDLPEEPALPAEEAGGKRVYEIGRNADRLQNMRLACEGGVVYLNSKLGLEPGSKLELEKATARFRELLEKIGPERQGVIEGIIRKKMPRLDITYFNTEEI